MHQRFEWHRFSFPIYPASPTLGHMPASLRGFGPLGLAAIALILAGNLLFLPLSALLVLAWAQASGTPWPEIGFVRPRSWTRSILIGIAFGALFKLAMKAIVMPLGRASCRERVFITV